MESKVIFDVATKPFAWEPLWASMGAVILGAMLILLKKLKVRYGSKAIGYIFILLAIVSASYHSARWYFSRREHVKALASGQFELVQGVVKNFRPMPSDGSSKESFSISGHTFSYSDYRELDPTTCFNQTAPHKGPIEDGLHLRVRFFDDCILQIELLSGNPNDDHK